MIISIGIFIKQYLAIPNHMRLVRQSYKQRTKALPSHLGQLRPERQVNSHGSREGPSWRREGEISEVVLTFWEKRERVEVERVEEETLEFVRYVFEVLIEMARVAVDYQLLKQEGERVIQIQSYKKHSEMVLYFSHFGTLLTGLLADVSACLQFKCIKEVVGSFSSIASELLGKKSRGLSKGALPGSSGLFEAIKECAGSILRLNGHKQASFRHELGDLFQVFTAQVGRVMWLFDSCRFQQN